MNTLLYFPFKKEQLDNHQASLSDTIRMAVYQKDETLFELLDYNDDRIFLEPTLFCQFLSDIDKSELTPLEQCLFGYIPVEDRPSSLTVKADRFGLVNLPNLGYVRAKPYETFTLSTTELDQLLIPNQFLPSSSIRFCWHPTDLLGYQKNITFYESTELTVQNYQKSLFLAVHFFQTNLPDFWQLIETVTREFVVFNSPPEHHSFAGIMHHGTAYFNVENTTKSAVFFIDDIAHQCGHIIFNALTLDTNQYLRVPKDFPLKEFTGYDGERRGVYGAFHGLFTYTTILHSLDTLLSSPSNFDDALRHEALGRLGFYLDKFGFDLVNLNNPNILTETSMDFHRQFAIGYNYIRQKYQSALSGFSYQNQPYTFQYNLFSHLNPLPKTRVV
ncbi:hypothetical protein WBJ53_15410 [Spirosoma sp. SC4-14]|uniref:hypothetical protein n=1 Tax=Spirosoma sp. SC4-14 TaxID=3128900 RepID=UPI0030D585FA